MSLDPFTLCVRKDFIGKRNAKDIEEEEQFAKLLPVAISPESR